MEICQILYKSPNNQVVCLAIVDFHCKFLKGKLSGRQELLRDLLLLSNRTGKPTSGSSGRKVLGDLLAGIGILCNRIT